MDKTKLLDRLGAVGDERLLLAKVLDRAGRTQNQNIPVSTDFLSPGEQVRAADLLRLAGISGYVAAGGYEGAERRLFVFLPDWQEPEDAAPPVRFLRAAYRAEDSVNHRDMLGSLMGLGIVREKVGDILMGEARADLIVMDTVAPDGRASRFRKSRRPACSRRRSGAGKSGIRCPPCGWTPWRLRAFGPPGARRRN